MRVLSEAGQLPVTFRILAFKYRPYRPEVREIVDKYSSHKVFRERKAELGMHTRSLGK
jgi:hypothetical protein